MKKMYLLISLLTLMATTISCKDNNEPIFPSDVIWIEKTDRSDTIVFKSIDGMPHLSLNRGKEIMNSHLLPKYGSGWYFYQIQGDSISLLNMYSSCSTCYKTYYFVIQGSELRIGDFYQKNAANPKSLTFVKM